MNYLISGQSGFIGQAITKYLQDKGETVIAIPRDYSVIHYIRFFGENPPDYIFHLGAYGNHCYQMEFTEAVNTNILGTYNILEAAKRFEYKKFYNFSTSSVTLEKQTYYSITKFCAEQLASMCERTVNIKPYSVYGPGEAKHRFIPRVISCLHSKECMQIDEDATHDWILISDFVDALFAGETEIGTGIKTTNKEIVQMLQYISGKKLNYVSAKLRTFDNSDWVAKRGVKNVGIYEGLKQTYEYFTS